ncbi:MAG: trypsin-like peptidase domain-containing protein [Gemmatimonadaceae bacterium]|nr:trypsin-like peptidase domain-containing protein [Gemmatimonadaceae bacterium]
MEKLLLRHLKGSKAGETETFALSAYPELLIGRDPAAAVRFDPAQDDLVGRQHARITRDAPDATTFTLSDLDSRNGTFLNKQRVTGKVAIRPGDIVQLGAGGPEFEFDVDPRPVPDVKATRLGMVSSPSADATRLSAAAITAPATPPSTAPVTANVPNSIGKATVERMITDTKKQSQNMNRMMAGAVGLLAVAGVAWAYMRPKPPTQAEIAKIAADSAIARSRRDSIERAKVDSVGRINGPVAASDIGAKYGPAVVQIYFSWKLEYSGQPVFHRYVENSYVAKNKKVFQIIPGGPRYIPTYIAVGNDRFEPALTLSQGQGVPIGVTGSGSGFVVSSDGFILTNRHVGANWMAPYQFDRGDGGVMVGDQGGILINDAGMPITTDPPEGWIPSESKQGGPKGIIGSFSGRHEYLKVGFGGNVTYIDAGPVTPSPSHDVALLSVKVPRPLTSLTLNDNYSSVRQGENVTVMGYPGVSDLTYAVVKSKDTFNKESQARVVPEVTLTTGTIAKVTKSADSEGVGPMNYYTPSGDRFQLNINTTGAGNSGGPLFDAQGRVIGIFFAGRSTDASVTFAVPIKYGMELMNVGPTAR